MVRLSRKEKYRRRRARARFLLALNLFMLAALVLVGGLVYAAWRNGDPLFPAWRDGDPPSSAHGSGSSASPDNTGDLGPAGGGTGGGASEAHPASPSPSAVPVRETVTIALVGDLLPAGRVAEAMRREGADYPFRKAKPVLESADLAVGNLETPFTSRGVPAENKQYVFKAAPEHAAALREAGFDALSLANNHILDQGLEGLEDTIAHLKEAGLAFMGAGQNEKEAYAPAMLERNGITVALIGLSRVVPEVSWKAGPRNPGVAEAYDTTRAIAAIREADEKADVVVVYMHWGVERNDQPEPYQREMGRAFIDAGADLVVGCHPHVLQGFEPYKGRWIAYSLGNFVFTTTGLSKTQETGVLVAECEKSGACALRFHPMFADKFQPAPMEPEAARKLLERIESVSFGAVIGPDGTITASEDGADSA